MVKCTVCNSVSRKLPAFTKNIKMKKKKVTQNEAPANENKPDISTNTPVTKQFIDSKKQEVQVPNQSAKPKSFSFLNQRLTSSNIPNSKNKNINALKPDPIRNDFDSSNDFISLPPLDDNKGSVNDKKRAINLIELEKMNKKKRRTTL